MSDINRKELHKAVRNVLFNDLGLNRGEVLKLIKEALDETMASSAMSEENLKKFIQAEIASYVEKGFPKTAWSRKTTFVDVVEAAVQKCVYRQLKGVEVDLKLKL